MNHAVRRNLRNLRPVPPGLPCAKFPRPDNIDRQSDTSYFGDVGDLGIRPRQTGFYPTVRHVGQLHASARLEIGSDSIGRRRRDRTAAHQATDWALPHRVNLLPRVACSDGDHRAVRAALRGRVKVAVQERQAG
jgi:hypothetical protein